MCKHLRVCVSMCVLTHHICVWRPEVSVGCFPQFFTLILDAGFLTAPELTTGWASWAPGPQGSTCLRPTPRAGVTEELLDPTFM